MSESLPQKPVAAHACMEAFFTLVCLVCDHCRRGKIKLHAVEVKSKHVSSCLSGCRVSIAGSRRQALCNGGEE